MTNIFVRIYIMLSILCLNSNAMFAMDVDNNSAPEQVEQNLISHIRNKICKIFDARERFIKQAIEKLIVMDDKDTFIDFMGDISTIDLNYVDHNSPNGDISSLKKTVLNGVITTAKQQKNLHIGIMKVIDQKISHNKFFSQIGFSSKDNNMERDFLVYLYIYINDGKEGSKKCGIQNKHKLLKEKIRKNNVPIFKFEDNFDPIILYQEFMTSITEELPEDVVRFLVNDSSINDQNRQAIIKNNLINKTNQISSDIAQLRSQKIDSVIFTDLFKRHMLLTSFIDLFLNKQSGLDDHTTAKAIVKLVEAEALHADIMLHLPKPPETSAKASFQSHKKKPKNKAKNIRTRKPTLENGAKQQLVANQNCSANGEQENQTQTTPKAPTTTSEQEKFESNNTTDTHTENKQDEPSCETNEALETTDLNKDDTEEFLDYHHYNKIRKANKNYSSTTSSTSAISTSSLASPVSTKFEKAKSLVNDFNKEELRIYRGLLSGKDLHKTYSFIDLLKIVAGFQGKQMGDGDSHFTFDIPDFGSVYLVRAHGSGRDNRWLSGTYVRIFIERLEELGLISDELRATYL